MNIIQRRTSSSVVRALVFSMSALFWHIGCGVPEQATNPEDYSDFLKLSYQQTCEARHRCCGTLCSTQLDTAFLRNVSRTLDYISRGLIQFDKQAAADCLSSQSKRFRDCAVDVLTVPLSRCDKIFIPNGQVGSPCETGINSCAPDTVCILSRCTARGKLGEVCKTFDLSIGCAPGLFCAQATATSQPQCTAYASVGKSCVSPARCDPTSGNVCLPSQLCGPPVGNGASCSQDSHCISTYCEPTSGICAPLPVPLMVRQQLCAQPEPTFPQ